MLSSYDTTITTPPSGAIECGNCGCDVEAQRRITHRECECTAAEQGERVICVACCASSDTPCPDALADYRALMRLTA